MTTTIKPPGKDRPVTRATPRSPVVPARAPGPAIKPAARPATKPAARPAARPAPARPATPPRTPFVLLIVALLAGALVSLLLLNTVLAQDAFTLSRLKSGNKQLEQQRQALLKDNAREESPANLARKAEALGMVRPTEPAFVDEMSKRVIGGAVRPAPQRAAAAAAAGGVIGVPGAVVPVDGTAPAAGP